MPGVALYLQVATLFVESDNTAFFESARRCPEGEPLESIGGSVSLYAKRLVISTDDNALLYIRISSNIPAKSVLFSVLERAPKVSGILLSVLKLADRPVLDEFRNTPST